MVFERRTVIVNCLACSGSGLKKWQSGKQLTCSVCKGSGKVGVVRNVRGVIE